jgi:hypothetical protein
MMGGNIRENLLSYKWNSKLGNSSSQTASLAWANKRKKTDQADSLIKGRRHTVSYVAYQFAQMLSVVTGFLKTEKWRAMLFHSFNEIRKFLSAGQRACYG